MPDTQNYIAFSDVHAFYPALETFLQHVHPGEQALFLGDAIGYGTEPRRTLSALYEFCQQNANTVALMGNHDALGLGLGDFTLASSQGAAMRQLAQQHVAQLFQDEAVLNWLRTLPIQTALAGQDQLLMAHDTFDISNPPPHQRPWSYATKNVDTATYYMRRLRRHKPDCRLLLVGHHHVPFVGRYHPQKRALVVYDPWGLPPQFDKLDQAPLIVNVGSIALPREGAHTSFVRLQAPSDFAWVRLRFEEIHYDWHTVQPDLENAMYPAPLRQTVLDQLRQVQAPH